MSDSIESAFAQGREHMDHAIDHLKKELAKIRTGKASTSLLEGIQVEYYGSTMPINQVANVGLADARTVTIQPWDKGSLGKIEQAIFAANLGITPMNDGEIIRITIPPLTEERRKDLAKQAKAVGEEGKVALRHARHKVIDQIKKEVKEGYPEDIGKRKEAEVDKLLHDYSDVIDQLVHAKEKDILTV